MLSDRAASAYAVMWCVGFVPACMGAYWKWVYVKWVGAALMTPFSLYLALMLVLGTISFVRAVRRGEM